MDLLFNTSLPGQRTLPHWKNELDNLIEDQKHQNNNTDVSIAYLSCLNIDQLSNTLQSIQDLDNFINHAQEEFQDDNDKQIVYLVILIAIAKQSIASQLIPHFAKSLSEVYNTNINPTEYAARVILTGLYTRWASYKLVYDNFPQLYQPTQDIISTHVPDSRRKPSQLSYTSGCNQQSRFLGALLAVSKCHKWFKHHATPNCCIKCFFICTTQRRTF